MPIRFLLLLLLIAGDLAAKETVMLPMRDGVKLATDIYRPEQPGSFPVILSRTPYNKDGLAGIGAEGIQRGYVVVAQDCRGRFASQGENLPFNLDGPDGFETIEWVARQSWCNGKIGTWGGSAVAITQFQMMATGTDKISAQHLTVGAPNLYDVIYVNGVFRKSLIEDWLKAAQWSSNALPRWVSHPVYDSFWRERDASRSYHHANAPALHIGGYWDIFAQATIDAFQEKVGELTFRDGKKPPGEAHDAWKWFEFTLQNKTGAALPAVTYYVLGDATDPAAPGNLWRTSDRWPPLETSDTRYYLHPDRTLSTANPGASKPLSYSYDPAKPAPTVGGIQLTIPAGPMDQKRVESREDVLVFTSPPLTAPIEVTGRLRAKIWISTDVPDTDFIARFCDVYPDGRSFNLSEGAARARFREGLGKETLLKPGKIYPLEIDLWSTSVILNTAHRLRLQITSSSSPGYDPNPNTGERFRSTSATRIAKIQLYVDERHPSHLMLPIAIPAPR